MKFARCLPLPLVFLVFIAAVDHPRAEEPRQAENAKAIIDKSLKAGGGVEKISKFKAIYVKGTCSGKDVETRDFAASFAGIDRVRLVFEPTDHQKKGIMVVNGGQCWTKNGDEEVQEFPKDDREPLAEFLHAMCLPDLLITLKGNGYALETLVEEKIGGKEAVGVRVTHEKHKEVRLFFDKNTGLPMKSMVKGRYHGAAKEEWCEFFFSNYKEVEGVQHFTHFKIRFAEDEIVLDIEIKEVELREKIDSSLFAKP